MKKLLYNTFVPEKDEIMAFQEVFGAPAGTGMSKWVHFGDRNNTKGNPIAICIALEPFTVTETEFLIGANSAMTNAVGGLRAMILSTKPYANVGDPDNVAEMRYGPGELNGSMRFFVNDVDAPPQGDVFTTKWIYKDGDRVQEQVKVDQGKWLKPHTQYYLTYRRLGATEGSIANNPLSVYCAATDDPARGGEVKLNVTDLVGDLDVTEFAMGDRTGVIVWDQQ